MKRIVKIEFQREDGPFVWVGGHIVGKPAYVKPAETIIPKSWLPVFQLGGHFYADGDTIRTLAPGEALPQ